MTAFDGGRISSDGGLPLVSEVDRRRRIVERFATCFEDLREPGSVEHSVVELLRQRLYALASGYEDLNDHDELRKDALLAAVVGKRDPEGQARKRERDRGSALAGKSTLNRLEWGVASEAAEDRYRRIAISPEAVDRFFVDVFLEAYDDATGRDRARSRCDGRSAPRRPGGPLLSWLLRPLLLPAALRLLRPAPAVCPADDGRISTLRRAASRRSPGSSARSGRFGQRIKIVVRGDCGFARDALMSWCEEHGVDYVLGSGSKLQASGPARAGL